MTLNDSGIDLIKNFESCRLQAYQDDKGVWTIGFGCTHHVRSNSVISQEEADERFEEDIKSITNVVLNLILPRQITENQFSACVSLAYNIGIGNFKSSTVLYNLKMGHLDDAAKAILLWNKETIDGVKEVSKGLSRRREAEKNLFLSDG